MRVNYLISGKRRSKSVMGKTGEGSRGFVLRSHLQVTEAVRRSNKLCAPTRSDRRLYPGLNYMDVALGLVWNLKLSPSVIFLSKVDSSFILTFIQWHQCFLWLKKKDYRGQKNVKHEGTEHFTVCELFCGAPSHLLNTTVILEMTKGFKTAVKRVC